jgi:superfamily II DNA or RNA helicase
VVAVLSKSFGFPEVPFAHSGKGKEITEKITKPLLNASTNYDRVSGYFSPSALRILIEEFASVWKSGGTIRLIMGFHDQSKIFDESILAASDVKQAVSLALQGQIKEIRKHLDGRQKEVISELCTQRAIQVRLAIPPRKYDRVIKNQKWDKHGPIFHSKFAIFHREQQQSKPGFFKKAINSILGTSGVSIPHAEIWQSANMRLINGAEFVVVTGSQNDSQTAFEDNVEDALVHRSSEPSEKKYASYFVDRFEDLWWKSSEMSDVVLVPFDSEFMEFMDEVSGGKTGERNYPKLLTLDQFYGAVSLSPVYHSHMLPNVGLMPHQMNVYRDTLSRWPIRGLIADEVGLGKTIEAGSVLDYCYRFLGIKRIAIITPAELRNQWRSEMETFFDLDFAIYRSENKEYEFSTKQTIPSQQVFAVDAPELQIISWHYMRSKSIQQLGDWLPELLIVDEAHNARSNSDGPLKLLSLLRELKEMVPHVLLLTATPYQTKLQDMHDLLDLIGLPSEHNLESLERHVDFVANRNQTDLDFNLRQIKLLHSSLSNFMPTKYIQHFDYLEKLSQVDFSSVSNIREYVSLGFTEYPRVPAMECHPTNLIMSRNTREQLKHSGYQFPTTKLHGSKVILTDTQSKWFNLLDEYLCEHHQLVERRTSLRSSPIGFNRNNFRLRIVSSINAAMATLTNRENKLDEWKGLKVGGVTLNESRPIDQNLYDAIQSNADTELSYLREVLRQLEQAFVQSKSVVDPKLEQLKLEVEKYLALGCKILVFSQYTATTKAVMEKLHPLSATHSFGRYDGDEMGLYNHTNSTIEPKDKDAMKKALRGGKIEVLVCSNMASEGLNLQTASVVINVDVPYNPAILMQRFGRVDRLGQKSPEVHLVNLYYPGTVEDGIFAALARRWDELVAVTGSAPKILDRVHEEAIRDDFDMQIPIDSIIEETIYQTDDGIESCTINTIQPMNEFLAHSPKKWIIEEFSSWFADFGLDAVLKDSEAEIESVNYSWSPTDENFVQWKSDLMEYLTTIHFPDFDSEEEIEWVEVFPVVDEKLNTLVLVGSIGSSFAPLPLDSWRNILSFIINGEPLNSLLPLANSWEDAANEVLINDIKIDHSSMKTMYPKSVQFPTIVSHELGKSLGFLPVLSSCLHDVAEEE